MRKVIFVFVLAALLITPVMAGGAKQSVGTTGGKPYAGVQLNVLDVSHLPSTGLRGYLGEFEESTGIKVNFEIEEASAIHTKKEVELSARSDAYDVMHIDISNVTRYVTAGWVENLATFINASPEFDFNDILESASDIFKVNNGIYGIPVTTETIVIYYRPDVFKELGLAPPKSPADLITVCEAIKNSGMNINPISLRGRQGQGNNIFIWGIMLYPLGGGYYNNGLTALTLNSPETVESVKLYTRLVQEFAPPGCTDFTYTDAWTAFAQGQVAMYIDSSNAGSNFQRPDTSTIVDKWDVARVFTDEKGKYLPFHAHGVAINNFSRKKEAAWEFVKWYTGKDMQRRLGEDIGYAGTARQSSKTSNAYRNMVGPNRWIEAVNESMGNVRQDYRPVSFPEWPYIGDTIGAALQNVFMGDNAQTTMDEVQREMTAFFRQNGYLK